MKLKFDILRFNVTLLARQFKLAPNDTGVLTTLRNPFAHLRHSGRDAQGGQKVVSGIWCEMRK